MPSICMIITVMNHTCGESLNHLKLCSSHTSALFSRIARYVSFVLAWCFVYNIPLCNCFNIYHDHSELSETCWSGIPAPILLLTCYIAPDSLYIVKHNNVFVLHHKFMILECINYCCIWIWSFPSVLVSICCSFYPTPVICTNLMDINMFYTIRHRRYRCDCGVMNFSSVIYW